MSPRGSVLYRLIVCAVMLVLSQRVFAAVLILEGTPSPGPQPATSAAPPAPAADQPPAQPAPPLLSPDGEGRIPGPANAPAAPAGPAVVVAPAGPADLDTSKLANPAEVSVEMMPGQTVSVGSRVSFRVSSKKAGYLVLIDVDPAGKLAQLYPNTASLVRTARANGNYIKPGGTLTIPVPTDPYAGAVQYIVSAPAGEAMVVAILSAQPVQIVDLPDVPADIKDRAGMLAFLSRWTSELRIP